MHERERDRVAPALRGARRRIAALDLAAVRWVARVNSPALDRAMPALSEAANHGKLWIALGACLQATGNRRAGRAARRGLASLAVASATANIIGKGLASRRRPDAEVPAARRLPHAPWTSSFPSGHDAPDYVGMLHQRVLDVTGVHVVAAADDQVLDPVDDVQVAVLVQPAHVTGGHPAVPQPLHGALRSVPVAAHQRRPAHADLAVGACPGHRPVRPLDADLDTGRWPAHAALPRLA